MAETLRGGVIGAGVFGGYHARQYANLAGVVLSGVLDTHPDRAARVAMPLGGRGFHEMDEFLEAVDVVTIASPATFHAGQALAVLAAGKARLHRKACRHQRCRRRTGACCGGRQGACRRLRAPGTGAVPGHGAAGRAGTAAAA
jgi:hypothetical protein